jgi:hypothetical protein
MRRSLCLAALITALVPLATLAQSPILTGGSPIYGTSGGGLTATTSAQIVAALNASPSTTLAMALFPTLPYVAPTVTVNGHALSTNVVVSYPDLTSKPTIPAAQVSSDWNSNTSPTQILNKPNPLLSGSTLLPSQAGRIPVATAQMPTSGWTAQHSEGDSISAGSDATSAAHRYVNLINAAVGSPSLTNNAVGGSYGCDVTNRIFNEENPGATSTTLQTLMTGINDAVNGPGVGTYEAVFKGCHMAALSWLATQSTLKYTGASFGTIPTNWSADNTFSQVEGISSTTNGASAVFYGQSLHPNANGYSDFAQSIASQLLGVVGH